MTTDKTLQERLRRHISRAVLDEEDQVALVPRWDVEEAISELERLTAERDALRAEVEALRAEPAALSDADLRYVSSVLDDVLADISDWEDTALAEAVTEAKNRIERVRGQT